MQLLEAAGAECTVRRCDDLEAGAIAELGPDRIVLSPGPFGPDRTGASGAIVRRWAARVPILGVCLGMQVIARVGGAAVVASGAPVHGQTRRVLHGGGALYRGVPSPFTAALYHSLVLPPDRLGDRLQVTARSQEGTIMGVRLRDTMAEGVLFHPESFLTPDGPRILRNFLAEEVVAS